MVTTQFNSVQKPTKKQQKKRNNRYLGASDAGNNVVC